MNIVDRDIEKAEESADYTSFQNRQRNQDEQGASRASSSSIAGEDSREVLTASNTRASQHPDYLQRLATHKSQHLGTVGSSTCCKSQNSELPFGGGKPYPPKLPGREQYVVEFDGKDDPLHGMNWSTRKKLFTAALLMYTTWVVAIASSIFAPAIHVVSHKYGVNWEVGELGISLFVLGFASGPVLWAPMSELKGRRLPLLIAGFGFSIFSIAVATGKDLQTILICRFWSGFCGACPITISPAVFSDVFNNKSRGLAVTVFSIMLYNGTLSAPFIGGFITISHLGWRWTEYIPAILGFSSFGLNVLFLQETYPPLILCAKASELRRRTLNWGIHAKQEEVEIDVKELISKNFGRPIRMLFTEPIVFLVSLYMSLLYGIAFIFLAAYAIVFQKTHGMNEGVGSLPLLGIFIGVLMGSLFIILQQPAYSRKLSANNNVPVPEWRCPPAIIGGVCFTLGLFWFGWTGQYESVHWIVPTVSGVLTGFGILAIFLSMLNYLVDSYLVFAASAVAANTMMRSFMAAACPLFSTYMFNRLGINWGMTLVGCFAAILLPIPVWFFFSGAKIRKQSKFAPTAD